MSGFSVARGIEARGLIYLMPFLREHSNGELVMLNKGGLAKHLQETYGDAMFNRDGKLWVVEIKVEAENRTGNFFLEIFSNRNLEDRASHAERGINPGWLFKLRSDLLFYYFLDTDDLYIISLFRLQQWAFGARNEGGNIWRYEQKPQGKYSQLNDTWGACVPIGDIADYWRHVKARQISLFDEAA